MANEEHLAILKQGVEAWNEWRKNNPEIVPDLSRADLHFADLSGADLSLADLSDADLSDANLAEVNLSFTTICGTDFTEAWLKGTDFTKADCGFTKFIGVDLSTARGLETIRHTMPPSFIDIGTCWFTGDAIPAALLRGCEVPEHIIAHLPSLLAGKEIKFPPNSIFGSPIKDQKFQCDVFMIMPFAEGFQPIYEDHVKSVVEGLGHTIRRGDDFFGKTSIMTDIWSAINNTKLVIAECTGRNPNVFYEMGIAHSLDKAVIMITQSIDDIPFDIRHLRVIQYKYNPRGMAKFEAALKTAICNLIGK